MNNKKLRILDYYQVLDEIKRITDNGDFFKQQSVKTLHDNIEIPYYTLGTGDNHIVICGGTHGSEIISVDFVLRLMESISKKEGIYSDIDLDSYTFHFIPLHNPEGYIVSTSVIRTLIERDASEEEIERISKKYFMNYRQDDINTKRNSYDRSQKLHQKMFEDATYECIPEEFRELRENIKKIYSNPSIPKGSIIVHRGNGLGQETNRSMLSKVLTNVDEDVYGTNRYNNIDTTIPGPLGTIPENENIIENIFLKHLIDKLYKEGKYCGMLTYHGTGGLIYSKLSNDDEKLIDELLTDEYIRDKYRMNVINRILTRKYQEDTKYITPNGSEKPGYKIVQTPSLKDIDEYLRISYPAVLLIELSYMGGNPIGPLGDKDNNYIPMMEHNLIATYNFIKTCKYLKEAMYGKIDIIDNEVSNEWEKEHGKTL